MTGFIIIAVIVAIFWFNRKRGGARAGAAGSLRDKLRELGAAGGGEALREKLRELGAPSSVLDRASALLGKPAGDDDEDADDDIDDIGDEEPAAGPPGAEAGTDLASIVTSLVAARLGVNLASAAPMEPVIWQATPAPGRTSALLGVAGVINLAPEGAVRMPAEISLMQRMSGRGLCSPQP